MFFDPSQLMMKTTPDRRRPPEEVLAFMLGDEEYGIDMQKVQEICGFDAIAQDASPVDLDNGVLNLRGICMPVVDMRVRYALGKPVYDESTSVIVLNIGGRIMSLIVDGISDVHRLDAVPLQPVPRNKGMLRDCLIGLGTFGQHRIILIAVDKLMTASVAVP